MKNVYIINNVLSDYTSGMVVMIAPDLAGCRALFENEFSDLDEFDKAIEDGQYEVIPADTIQESRIVSYVYGGG